MRFGYGWILQRVSRYSKQIMLVVGLIALPISARIDKMTRPQPLPNPAPPPKPVNPDPRTIRLAKFFAKLHCPVVYLASDFVRAADQNQLDWRLLPSISVVESGGGKAYRNNNIFGWNQGQALFPSIRAGLDEVAFKLGKGPLYRKRDLVGKLRLYNPDESYVGTVLGVMNRISPTANFRHARRIPPQSTPAYATD